MAKHLSTLRRPRRLASLKTVIRALGGVTDVARLTGRTPPAVCNWAAKGTFPPRLYLVMIEELERRGCRAPPSLWGMSDYSVADKDAA